MKIVITGFSNSGKTTVFNALTGLNLETTTYPTMLSVEVEPHIGIVKVPDKRIDKLSSIYKPKKTTYATIEYIDYVGITSASAGSDISQNIKVFDLIKDADATVHVVRAFEDKSIMHPLEEIDPLSDIKSFETELIIGDLEFVEKRLERIELAAKRGKKPDEADRKFLLKCKKALEDGISLRNISFSAQEKRVMLLYQFLSTMPEIIVLNIGETDLNTEKDTIPHVITLCGKIEMEIAQLPQDERKEFLDDMRIEEPAMNKLCKVSYDALGLISFFTVIKDEVKAWTIKGGTEALKAAGKIHSDIERGFIKAEVINFEDFISSGEDIVKAREKGLGRLEGKSYIVKEGDIINFKFNV